MRQLAGGVSVMLSAVTALGFLLLIRRALGCNQMVTLNRTLHVLRCRERPHDSRLQRFFEWICGTSCVNSVVVLRTANPHDAVLYHTLLLPLQKKLNYSFILAVEKVTELDKMVVIELRTREFHREYTRGAMLAFPELPKCSVATAPSIVSSCKAQERLVLCRVPLPDLRVYRDIPAVISRLIAAHGENRRLFSSYAEEMLFYLPFIEANSRCQNHPQQQSHQIGTTTVTKASSSTASLSHGEEKNVFSGPDTFTQVEAAVLGNSFPSTGRSDESAGLALLGDVIDINATMFSTSWLVGVGDEAVRTAEDVGSMNSRGEDQFIHDAIHEAFFHVVLRTPLARPDFLAAETLKLHPFKVWRASRRSRRAAAELYVLDVAAAKGDAVISFAHVVDEVVAQAVLVHHRGSLAEFVDALFARFALRYTPVIPALREVVERRRGGVQRRQPSGENSERDLRMEGSVNCSPPGAGPSGLAVGFEDGVVDDEEDIDEVVRELHYTREYILEHRITFYNAVLTAQGSNQLEEVFGVPATVFPFLPCARESVAFVTHAYECIVAEYGPLDFHNFTKYAHDVFVRDRPEIVRHAPRIFRMLNKTRSGVISFEELCCWIARKLSSGSRQRPDAHLIAIAMSLRLPMALVFNKRKQWPRMECALASLSDADVEGY
ncbi:Present in the outer mitochondrial membrane proteome 36 [Trypanosoma cruzi]|nr:Present in the outer mitochondrial membrane proteome 36 [Trypanosoma cruzi]RNC60031.1 hypothetical protein TcCL_ESM02246 [Trypanosoma cruzi]